MKTFTRPKHIRDFQKEYSIGDFFTETNPKVAKNSTVFDIPTIVLHLLPNYRGTCPFAGTCVKLCLNRAGNIQYLNAKMKARKKRTDAFFADTNTFMEYMLIEAVKFRFKHREYKTCGMRCNGTSDMMWEKIHITVDVTTSNYLYDQYGFYIKPGRYRNIFYALRECSSWYSCPEIAGKNMFCFYDYTKRTDRLFHIAAYDGYHLTMSAGSSGDVLRAAIDNGLNIAAPFNIKKGQPLPTTVKFESVEFPVIDGDVSDFRPYDEKDRRYIVGLRLKKVPGMTQEQINSFCIA